MAKEGAKEHAMTDEQKELFDRIQSGDVDLVRQLLRSSAKCVNCLDEHGMTPLQNAAFKGNLAVCELLLSHGADVNANHHENGYTTLMFAALSGNTDVTRLMLESGAKTSPTNSVGRTAAQMAAFVGQHACVSIINNFFDRDKLDYYTTPRGFEKEPKLPPSLSPSLHKMILMHNLNPVKLTRYLQSNSNLLNEAYKITQVLELICEKEMKSSDTNDVLAIKMHYLASLVRLCHKWNMEKEKDGVQEFIKFLLRARETDGARLNTEKMLREFIREFPFHESELFVQIVRNLSDVKIGDFPTALGILTQAVNGARSLELANPCSTCGEANAAKKCSACKAVMYCDADCQKLEWFTHKKQCKRLGQEEKQRLEDVAREKQRVEEEERKKKEAQQANGTDESKQQNGASEEPSPPVASKLEEATEKLADTTVG